MISAFVARGIILVFGTLFPAYYSYKAVKTKNVKEYVKWMMYWIVFAFFTCLETITDLFLAFWFPFYYEAKILLVLWLLSPATRGSSVLYRKFVHPWLTQREDDIDEYIARAKQQGYSTVLQLGTKGFNYATSVIMQTAIKGGGGLVNQLKRSYSVGELAEDDVAAAGDMNRNVKALPPAVDAADYHYAPHHHQQLSGTQQPHLQQQNLPASQQPLAASKQYPQQQHEACSTGTQQQKKCLQQQQPLLETDLHDDAGVGSPNSTLSSTSSFDLHNNAGAAAELSEEQSSSDELCTLTEGQEGGVTRRSMNTRSQTKTNVGPTRTRLFF
uniref:Receptor expression-enhancing protein n=1 Tax=Hirondellea gigas TaxID=1518452 RepID=A0A2P2I6T8_9CRUS